MVVGHKEVKRGYFSGIETHNSIKIKHRDIRV